MSGRGQFPRAIFISCDFCLTGGLGTSSCEKETPLDHTTPSHCALNPLLPGEVLVLNGKAQSRIRIGIALKGG